MDTQSTDIECDAGPEDFDFSADEPSWMWATEA